MLTDRQSDESTACSLWIRAMRTGTIRVERFMKNTAVIVIAVVLLSGPLVAQERKPAPKDSVRVSFPDAPGLYLHGRPPHRR